LGNIGRGHCAPGFERCPLEGGSNFDGCADLSSGADRPAYAPATFRPLTEGRARGLHLSGEASVNQPIGPRGYFVNRCRKKPPRFRGGQLSNSRGRRLRLYQNPRASYRC
jgi:hypothetical protein